MTILARVDFRLIHGQIIARWKHFCGIERIVVIDDILAADEFMMHVYASSLPVGVEFSAYTEAEALQRQKRNCLSENERVMILFKDITACHRCIKAGLKLSAIQLGGIPGAKDRRQITRGVFLNADDMRKLRELHNDYGVEITVQNIPEDTKMNYEQLLEAYKAGAANKEG